MAFVVISMCRYIQCWPRFMVCYIFVVPETVLHLIDSTTKSVLVKTCERYSEETRGKSSEKVSH